MILHFAELGVVMFLFNIGLELRSQKLWALRGQIFGLGLAQVSLAIALLSLAGVVLFALPPVTAFIAGAGFVLSSTAVIMSTLQERGETSSTEGQKSVSILLFEDLLIVPLLAVVAFKSPVGQGDGGLAEVALALAGLVALLVAGRWLLGPFFALLARARAREVLSAGALLVVLGAAFLMEAVGLSMAMGAFLAGVLLSGSSYRHQIESDIELLFASEIRKKRVERMKAYSLCRWHLDKVFVKINGKRHYLWRAVDHEGEVLESFVTKTRDRKAAL